jgi:hypothetical protein
MKNIPENTLKFKDFEKRIFTTLCQVGCELLSDYLQSYDDYILATRDIKEYECVNFGKTTIKTVMGEVSYMRRCYKKKTGGHIFLLDEALGIGGGYGLVSENLAEQIAIECSEKSYRKAAASISSLTGQTISAMGAWGVVQQYGEKLKKQEEKLKQLDESGETGQLGNIACPVLFSELDDVWISRQRDERRRAGAPAVVNRKRIGKKPMRIGTAYTGWSQESGNRYKTEDKIAYASFGAASEFASTFEILLRHRFDMDGVRYRIMSGDGDPWIRSAAEESDSILQLDSFHRSQAVLRAVSDKKSRNLLFKAIDEKDADKALAIISGLIVQAEEGLSREKLKKLYDYFFTNHDSLFTWQERGIKLPPPPKGIVYRGLGVQESSNCNLITQRMKHCKGSWSVKGANNMAKLLCFKNTIGLDAILRALPEASATEVQAEPLSAAKAPGHDGNGYNGEWLYAKMPFDQTFKTNGREAIRGRLKQIPLSNLAFK